MACNKLETSGYTVIEPNTQHRAVQMRLQTYNKMIILYAPLIQLSIRFLSACHYIVILFCLVLNYVHDSPYDVEWVMRLVGLHTERPVGLTLTRNLYTKF